MAVDGNYELNCILNKLSTEAIDFETNHKDLSNKDLNERGKDGKRLSRTTNVHVDEFLRVRHKGIFDVTCPSMSEQDYDWQIDQLNYWGQNKPSYMTGVKYKVVGGNDGDTLDFCVVDKDNILGYGAGAVLDGFAQNYPVFPDEITSLKEHKADLITGLYLRAHYKNTGVNPARFICAIYRYMDTK